MFLANFFGRLVFRNVGFSCCRFVTFNSDSEAASAVQQFDGFVFMGKRLKVSISEQSGSQRQGRSDDNSLSAAKPWDGGSTGGGSAKPWGGGQNDNSSSTVAKPWGSSGGSGFSNGFSSNNGKEQLYFGLLTKIKTNLPVSSFIHKVYLIGTWQRILSACQ